MIDSSQVVPRSGIGQEMDLIEDDAIDIVEIPRRLQEHVSQDFGRHHHDAGVAIFGNVSGQQANIVAVGDAQIAEFLIGERLDRGGVDDACRCA